MLIKAVCLSNAALLSVLTVNVQSMQASIVVGQVRSVSTRT